MGLDWRLRERRGERRDRDGWQTSGGVVVDTETGRVLLVKNRRELKEGGGWTWPKGLIDTGEGPVFAAIREIAEETGVLAEPLGRVALIQSKRALRHYFLLTKIRDGLPYHRETIDARWVTVDEATSLLSRKRDRRVLRAAKRALRLLARGGCPHVWHFDNWLAA